MKNFNPLRHPISLIQPWLQGVDKDWIATLSRYQYFPQQIEDRRDIVTIKLAELTPSWLDDQLGSLPEGYELAFHSVLRRGRRELHIPMVDFSAKSIEPEIVVDWAYRYLGITIKLFDSGRSFHGYGEELISRSKWIKLMGLLLLSNLPKEPPLVDARWVGHRLLAGYSALRWSQNSANYLRIPTKI
jgi:hypothetical protein